MYRVRYFLVHTNSDSAKREKEAVTFAIRVRTMWYEEKVSNFEIAVAKLKETLKMSNLPHFAGA